MKRLVLGTVVASGLALVGAIVACQTTEDPRAGTGRPGTSSGATSSGGASSSGGIDAAPPAEPLACGDAPVATEAFSKRALLAAAASCAGWHACTFLNAATALRTAVRAHEASPTDASLAAARTAWREAMVRWSSMELFQFGPVGSKVSDPYHGRGLRSFVHPWPQTSRCEVEKQVATKEWRTAGIGAVLPSGRGLFADELLLHPPDETTACLPGSAAGQAWAALTPEARATEKRAYGVAVADNVLALGLEIHGAFQPAGENFPAKLLAAEGYGSEQEALNVVGWSMFYVEGPLKDDKLASRAGVSTAPPNPETPFAKVEIEAVRENLRAFRRLFQGCGAAGAGLGFDDWLVAAGHGALANDILAALAGAEAAADAFPPFDGASVAQFRALYDAVKVLSDLLKASLFGSASPLNLKLPASVASDTD